MKHDFVITSTSRFTGWVVFRGLPIMVNKESWRKLVLYKLTLKQTATKLKSFYLIKQ